MLHIYADNIIYCGQLLYGTSVCAYQDACKRSFVIFCCSFGWWQVCDCTCIYNQSFPLISYSSLLRCYSFSSHLVLFYVICIVLCCGPWKECNYSLWCVHFQICDLLTNAGIRTGIYHGQMGSKAREESHRFPSVHFFQRVVYLLDYFCCV